ncbi:MAG: DNA recombination protein RmuC [Candidatus Omnitrophica bacterium]|nr:DNA recombination protein RmuC [Candidatus Omnitrophota bacterium]
MQISVWVLIGSVAAIVVSFVVSILILKEIVRKEVRQEFDFSRGQLQEKSETEMEIKKQAVESSVKDLKESIDKYAQMVHRFEKDRDEKYGSLANELKNTSQATVRLQETTSQLTNVLGNNQKRGEWGERMAEDIIQLCGLREGVNYKKQAKIDSSGTKPDYTFLLPNKHKINMDVKFPLSNYQQMVNAEDVNQKDMHKKQFLSDVKQRLKEIQNRSYINPAEGTLDFVLVFIPNEQVFGFIQENFPGLVDEALKQKVVLCSPFTLYSMLSVIRQAFENFYYEKATKEIIRMIDLFVKTYATFKERFASLGDAMKKTVHLYADIRDKSFKNLDTKINRIEDFKKGKMSSSEEPLIIDVKEEGE